MSSNMAIPKICSYCDKTFKVKTTLIGYYVHNYNSRHYKQKAKKDKIQNTLVDKP